MPAARGGSLGVAVAPAVASSTTPVRRSAAAVCPADSGFPPHDDSGAEEGRDVARSDCGFSPREERKPGGPRLVQGWSLRRRRTSRRRRFRQRRCPGGVLRAVHQEARPGLRGRHRRSNRCAALQAQPVTHEDDTSGGTIYPTTQALPVVVTRCTCRSVRRLLPTATSTRLGLRHRHHDIRQQRQLARQLVELHRSGRSGSAPDQPDWSVRLPVRRQLGHLQLRPHLLPEDQEPASTNLFYQHNRIHDEFYGLGFTESGGNFQVNNFDKGGQPGRRDPGLVQAGAVSGGSPTYTGRDNAYLLTLPDGIPPWSGMFLWEPINDAFEGPCARWRLRRRRNPARVRPRSVEPLRRHRNLSLDAHQSGSMGEGWGDWYALDTWIARATRTTRSRRLCHRQQLARHPQLGLRREPDDLRRHRLRPGRTRGARRR